TTTFVSTHETLSPSSSGITSRSICIGCLTADVPPCPVGRSDCRCSWNVIKLHLS
ncbi:hypothetical protein BgiMline_034961, partial [Biomphalaria glabrata]